MVELEGEGREEEGVNFAVDFEELLRRNEVSHNLVCFKFSELMPNLSDIDR